MMQERCSKQVFCCLFGCLPKIIAELWKLIGEIDNDEEKSGRGERGLHESGGNSNSRDIPVNISLRVIRNLEEIRDVQILLYPYLCTLDLSHQIYFCENLHSVDM